MPQPIADLRRCCQDVLDRVGPPRPFSVEALCRHVRALRERPLHLHPMPMQAVRAGAYGLWLATATDDHIFYEEHTTRLHQEHIVLHEISHILFDHHSVTEHDGQLHRLLRDLDPQLIHRLLARTNYSTHEEQVAEMLASLMRTCEHARGAADRPPGMLGRLQAALGLAPASG
ncbi:hypothetical protein ACWD4B_08425 [Streptomyces sp. NPDC002536]